MTSRTDEIAARVEAATPGPWRPDSADPQDVVVWGAARDEWIANVGHWCAADFPEDVARHVADADAKDAAFIAAARSDVPWLLEEVARLRAALVETRDVLIVVPYHANPMIEPGEFGGYPKEGHKEYACRVCLTLGMLGELIGPYDWEAQR